MGTQMQDQNFLKHLLPSKKGMLSLGMPPATTRQMGTKMPRPTPTKWAAPLASGATRKEGQLKAARLITNLNQI
jgi:hypothetical protein